MARKDRENMILEQLQAADAQGYKWEGLKAARKTFQPKRVKFRNAEGNLIKESDFASEAARYLSEVQWAPPNHAELNADHESQKLYNGGNTMIDSNFSLQELNKVIGAQKNNKAPGPDNCTAELIKWLDQDNRGKLLDIYNNILDSDVYPESLKLANIVSIF